MQQILSDKDKRKYTTYFNHITHSNISPSQQTIFRSTVLKCFRIIYSSICAMQNVPNSWNQNILLVEFNSGLKISYKRDAINFTIGSSFKIVCTIQLRSIATFE